MPGHPRHGRHRHRQHHHRLRRTMGPVHCPGPIRCCTPSPGRGACCARPSATVVVAWFVRATVILRFGAQTPMAINTALALTVTGTALAAVTVRQTQAALVAGVFDEALGAVVLAEYALGRGLGIDQLILHPYLAEPDGLPGRMAINTAVCLTLAGAALLAWGPWHRQRHRPPWPWRDRSWPRSPSSRPSGTRPTLRPRTAGGIWPPWRSPPPWPCSSSRSPCSARPGGTLTWVTGCCPGGSPCPRVYWLSAWPPRYG